MITQQVLVSIKEGSVNLICRERPACASQSLVVQVRSRRSKSKSIMPWPIVIVGVNCGYDNSYENLKVGDWWVKFICKHRCCHLVKSVITNLVGYIILRWPSCQSTTTTTTTTTHNTRSHIHFAIVRIDFHLSCFAHLFFLSFTFALGGQIETSATGKAISLPNTGEKAKIIIKSAIKETSNNPKAKAKKAMSGSALAKKLSIDKMDLKDKRVLIRYVSFGCLEDSIKAYCFCL